MNYFVTGITGTVVPVIIENLMQKDDNPHFYFAIRKGADGTDVASRLESAIRDLELDWQVRREVSRRATAVEIDVAEDRLGIAPDLYEEVVAHTEKILHGAADVRFDQPYEKIKVSNVIFTQKVYDIFSDIKARRRENGQSEAAMYYISTGYAYGIYKTPIPEDYPEFHPGPPDNTYAQTKAEAKAFILDKIKANDERIVIFEPTIIGGSAETGRTRTYNLHYVVMMLGYLGKLPFLTTPDNTLDIVPVDWVAAIVSDIMAGDQYHQGVLRMAAGEKAVTIRYLHDVGYNYYVENDPVEGRVIPKIRFIPHWIFNTAIGCQKAFYQVMYMVTRNRRYRKLIKGISLLEGYFPYITGYKVFENAKSQAVIEQYTNCGPAPAIQDICDSEGNLLEKGYYEKVLADTLQTGWGGMVDFDRLRKKQADYSRPQAAYESSRK
ncbi:MAG: SDR family oxidoreductase [Thermodesulfobacteriota bacterium]